VNLSEIRDLFVKRSGRYDLITEDGQDNGANFFIQSGSRFLDRRSNVRQAQMGASVHSVGKDGLFRLPDCWLIQEVLVSFSDGWHPLRKLSARHTPHVLFARSGRPIFYIPKVIRYAPAMEHLPATLVMAPASSFDHQDMASNSMLVEVLPHPTEPTPVEVRGNFYTAPLVHDEDVNTWSESFPDTLIKAALYQLEIFYRNTEGANDWLVSIQLDLTDAEQMEVLSDIQHKDTMGL
jgi:hypothetical protein